MDLRNEPMAQVLADMCGGSAEAFEAFYSAYAPFVLSVAERIVGERMEAEDVCHDVFLEALRRGREYDPLRGSVKAWLAVMARSRSLDRLRKRRRQLPEEEPGRRLVQAAASGEEDVLLKLQAEAVKEALGHLPDPQRRAVVGSYFGYLTQTQMSDAWKVPVGTVKSWMRYGVHNLRKQLQKQGWEETAEGGSGHER